MLTHRRALVLGGGGAAALLLAGVGYRAWDRWVWSPDKGKAYSPWSDWEGHTADGIKRPLRYSNSRRPIRTIPNPGCSGLGTVRLPCLLIVPGIWVH